MSDSPERLGFHGLVIETSELEADARRWASRTGLPVLFRGKREVILGEGPELFVRLRRGSGPLRITEAHLAVRNFSLRNPSADALGGDSRRVPMGPLVLALREFRRAPSPRWRRKRPSRAPNTVRKRPRPE
jgi:hypothetical protein